MGNSFPELAKKRIAGGITANDIAAAMLYICFAVYLYGYGEYFVLCGLYTTTAAWGTYFISKRWISNWTPSFFAGAVYGFGPFALSFELFHSLAGLSFAMVPWLLLPAVYWHKGKTPDAFRFCIRALLTLLPFGGIVLLFWVTAQPWAGPNFLMSKALCMTVKDFADLIFPLHKSGCIVPFGLYHCPLILALMGVFVYIKLQRIALLIPIAAGLVLSFWEPVFQVTPIVWAAFPILFLSLLCGVGFQAMVSAGKADSKWVMTCGVFASVLAAFFGAMAIRIIDPFRTTFEVTALIYTLTAVGVWITLFFIHAFPRQHTPRWLLLTAVMMVDLLYSAHYLTDQLF